MKVIRRRRGARRAWSSIDHTNCQCCLAVLTASTTPPTRENSAHAASSQDVAHAPSDGGQTKIDSPHYNVLLPCYQVVL
jgi:hypothetical protein